MSKYANSKHRDISFEIGEFVFVKLHPHCQQTVARRVNAKLTTHYYGLFKILHKIGEVAYRQFSI